MARDRKQWVMLDDILPQLSQGTSLQLKVDNQVIFEHARVWDELDNKYSLFSYLCDKRSTPYSVFLSMYTFYCANMGEQYARMLDAITRKYNPINNYEMIESGADGRKQSKRTDTDNLDTVSGTKNGDSSNTRTGSQTNEKSGSESSGRTYSGSQITDRYENAFDSGISENGTHTNKDVTQLPTYTDSLGFTNREDTLTYNNVTDEVKNSNNQTQNITVGSESLSASGQSATAGHSRNTKTEDYENDVSVSAKKQNADGTESVVALGTDFTDGTMHVFTRSGNIGVTTSMQMVSGEMEREKLNLLKMWVHGFIYEYCTYIHGSDE